MANRFDKFTDRARRVLTHAQEEAQRLNHNYIGTEHLLLGLLRERDGVACAVLLNLGVNANNTREAVEVAIGKGDRPVSGELGLTPRAKKVIELSVEEARRLNHSYIGTEHILLGLVREGEGVAWGILQRFGVDIDRVRTETSRVLNPPLASRGPFSRSQLREVVPGWRGPRSAAERPEMPEPLRLAPNAALRAAAIREIDQAKSALEFIQHDDLAHALVRALVVSQLDMVVGLFTLEPSTRQEYDDAMSRTLHSLSQINAARSAIQPGDAAASEALGRVSAAIAQALYRSS